MTAAMVLDALSPKFAEAQQVPQRRRAAEDIESVEYHVAAGLSDDARVPGADRPAPLGEVAVGAGGAREPRSEPAHRRHRAPHRARRLHGVCSRRFVPAGRLSGPARTRRASCSRRWTRPRRVKTSWLRPTTSRTRPDSDRQAWCRRLLLRRCGSSTCWRLACRNCWPPCRSTAAPAPLDDVPEDQGCPHAPVRRRRRARQRVVAGL